MASFKPTTLSQEQLAQLRELFYTVYTADDEVVLDAFKEMDEFFSTPQGMGSIETYRNTFWEWYVFATWKLLYQLPNDKVLQIAQYQIPDAIRQGENVEFRLLTYMAAHVPDPEQLVTFYRTLKKNILESTATLGTENNKPVSLSQIVGDLNKLNQNFDALQYSEFKVRVGKIISSMQFEHEYVFTPPEKILSNVLNLLNFLAATDENNIFVAVDAHTKPVLYKKLERGDFTSQPTGVPIEAIQEKLGPPVMLPPEKFAEIKEFLTSQFSQDASQQFEDLDGVMSLLDDTAVAMGDERIRELYIFNENTGQFEWNQQLLTAA